MRRLVREHRVTDDIANREDIGHVGAHLPVNRDETHIIDVDPGIFGADFFTVRTPPDRDQNLVENGGIRRLVTFEGYLQAILLRLDLGYLGFQQDGLVARLDYLGQRTHEILVATRDQAVHELDHGNLGTERVVDRGHLEADDAAADD